MCGHCLAAALITGAYAGVHPCSSGMETVLVGCVLRCSVVHREMSAVAVGLEAVGSMKHSQVMAGNRMCCWWPWCAMK